jgi:hypothetical protein
MRPVLVATLLGAQRAYLIKIKPSVKKHKSTAYEAVTVTDLCNTSSYLRFVAGLYCQSIRIPLTRVVSRSTFGEPTPQLNAGFTSLGLNIKEIKFQNFFSSTPGTPRQILYLLPNAAGRGLVRCTSADYTCSGFAFQIINTPLCN